MPVVIVVVRRQQLQRVALVQIRCVRNAFLLVVDTICVPPTEDAADFVRQRRTLGRHVEHHSDDDDGRKAARATFSFYFRGETTLNSGEIRYVVVVDGVVVLVGVSPINKVILLDRRSMDTDYIYHMMGEAFSVKASFAMWPVDDVIMVGDRFCTHC